MSSAAPLHVRAISLVLALSVVVGGWLVLEYYSRPPAPAGASEQSADTATSVEPAAQTRNAPPVSASQPAQSPRDVNLTFKCQKNGRTSFSDKPCDADAKVVSVTATEKSQPVPDDRMIQMRRQVAQMETDRHAREEAQAALFASRAVAPDANKAMQCKEVDDWIVYIDSHLRQPHSATTGDDLNAKRKKWMDRRFELRC